MGPLNKVYLGLGSNLGDREANLRRALELLGDTISLEKASSLYDTDPWGYQPQPRFLNCVCEGRTSVDPRALLAAVKEVERAIGREPSFANGPRAMDVDILFYSRQVIKEPGLQIPHARLQERAFVLVPLTEIAPALLHPVLKLTVADLLRKLIGDGGNSLELPEGVRLWAPPILAHRPH